MLSKSFLFTLILKSRETTVAQIKVAMLRKTFRKGLISAETFFVAVNSFGQQSVFNETNPSVVLKSLEDINGLPLDSC